MPKAELHLHLDGSLRIDTAVELARTRNVDAPRDRESMRAALVAPMPCHDQAELLRAFELPVALMQDAEALERTTAELVEAKAADGVRYVEIRWAPLRHVARGLSPAEVIGAVTRAARDAGREHRVEVRLISTALRSHDPAANAALARVAATFVEDGLTGWDLAGPEAAFPDPTLHAESFAIARDAGLGITVHAGEWGGAPQVRRALTLDPDRIAHGPGAIDDPDLCDELAARGIPLDLCPTSNWQAGTVETPADHPLARLYRRGVPVTLSTDDATVSDLSLTDEYERALDTIGLPVDELWAIDRGALDVAFADRPTVDRLVAEFDAWGR
jgi:adenosine deaminase